MFKLHDQNASHFKWIAYVKSIVDDTGVVYGMIKYLWKETF